MKIGLDTQLRLINQALESNSKLNDILAMNGLCYDDLRYKDCFDKEFDYGRSEYISLDNLTPKEEEYRAVSFFSGAGGLDIGFRYAGFKNIISIEHTELFCNTLRLNDPEKIVIGPPNYDGDIRDRETIARILIEQGVEENFNGVFHGGPPCQSFSIAANQRFSKSGNNFKRTGFEDAEKGMLIFDYIWYIKKFKPKGFLIENVEGITDCDEGKLVQKALDELRALGYSIPEPQILDAAYYGVPQHRKRWIVLGAMGNIAPTYPMPTEFALACGCVFRRIVENIPNHVTRMHKAESISRYMSLSPGARDHLGRVDRLDSSKPSKTVIAGGVKGGGRSHLHPFIPRTISVRECARIQTFPDSYVFTGTTARQFTQVGNAVPPMLAYRLALQLKKAIEDNQ